MNLGDLSFQILACRVRKDLFGELKLNVHSVVSIGPMKITKNLSHNLSNILLKYWVNWTSQPGEIRND